MSSGRPDVRHAEVRRQEIATSSFKAAWAWLRGSGLGVFLAGGLIACSRPAETPLELTLPPAPSAAVLLAPSHEPAPRDPRPQTSDQIAWNRWTLETAASARKQNKPVFVYASAAWCAPCFELDRRVFASEEVRREAARFVMVKLDLTEDSLPENEVPLAVFQPSSMPSMIFYDDRTGRREELTGLVDPGVLAERMRNFARMR